MEPKVQPDGLRLDMELYAFGRELYKRACRPLLARLAKPLERYVAARRLMVGVARRAA
jgi:hypothetical protein